MVNSLRGFVEESQRRLFACEASRYFASDGVLLLDYNPERDMYGMRMWNTDGSEAEMCGNGIRCVAREVEKILGCGSFVMYSGGTDYQIQRVSDIYSGINTYSVKIPVRKESGDFNLPFTNHEFIGRVIPEISESLKFTVINVGNPHLIAVVDKIDYNLLERIGSLCQTSRDILPNGVNVSFVTIGDDDEIFVATYERGVGLTASCGTAMTSSATTVALLGLIPFSTQIKVRNRGGEVICVPNKEGDHIFTLLQGNATYFEKGTLNFEDGKIELISKEEILEEQELYNKFLESLE